MTDNDSEITVLLERWSTGDAKALDQLLPLLYHELHRTAGAYMAQQRAGHTLQPTALVNEALMRMYAPTSTPFKNRSHFLAAAGQAMRTGWTPIAMTVFGERNYVFTSGVLGTVGVGVLVVSCRLCGMEECARW